LLIANSDLTIKEATIGGQITIKRQHNRSSRRKMFPRRITVFLAACGKENIPAAIKNFNDYFKCTQHMWCCTQGTLHCLIPREEDFLT